MTRTLIVLASFVVSVTLWLVKLYTVDYCHVDGTTGIFLRESPALENRERPGEGPHVGNHVYLIRADEWGYLGQDVYLWLMDYGYVFSTALSLVLLTLSRRARRLPAPDAVDRNPPTRDTGMEPPREVHRQ